MNERGEGRMDFKKKGYKWRWMQEKQGLPEARCTCWPSHLSDLASRCTGKNAPAHWPTVQKHSHTKAELIQRLMLHSLSLKSVLKKEPSVTVCTAERTLMLIKYAAAGVCFTCGACFKPKWVTLCCKKNYTSLFYILLRRWRPCSCSIHPNKLSLRLLYVTFKERLFKWKNYLAYLSFFFLSNDRVCFFYKKETL